MSDDKHLKQAVLDELAWEPSANATHIGTTTKDGIVTRLGSARSKVMPKSMAPKPQRFASRT